MRAVHFLLIALMLGTSGAAVSSEGVELWNGFRQGMTPEEVAERFNAIGMLPDGEQIRYSRKRSKVKAEPLDPSWVNHEFIVGEAGLHLRQALERKYRRVRWPDEWAKSLEFEVGQPNPKPAFVSGPIFYFDQAELRLKWIEFRALPFEHVDSLEFIRETLLDKYESIENLFKLQGNEDRELAAFASPNINPQLSVTREEPRGRKVIEWIQYLDFYQAFSDGERVVWVERRCEYAKGFNTRYCGGDRGELKFAYMATAEFRGLKQQYQESEQRTDAKKVEFQDKF